MMDGEQRLQREALLKAIEAHRHTRAILRQEITQKEADIDLAEQDGDSDAEQRKLANQLDTLEKQLKQATTREQSTRKQLRDLMLYGVLSRSPVTFSDRLAHAVQLLLTLAGANAALAGSIAIRYPHLPEAFWAIGIAMAGILAGTVHFLPGFIATARDARMYRNAAPDDIADEYLPREIIWDKFLRHWRWWTFGFLMAAVVGAAVANGYALHALATL